jgi:nicotinamide-nucleotide amidase
MYNTKALATMRDHLLKRKESIAVAESVTSGHLQAALSLAENATSFFQGGITTYNLGQKARHLKIEPIHALECNCVSPQIAEAMALGAAEIFSSDWGVGITGYAAPVPEMNIEKLFAFYAFSFRKKIIQTKKISATQKQPYEVQIHYVDMILKDFNHCLMKIKSK